MDPAGPRELEAAGIIDSKFGAVTLFRPIGGTEARAPASASSSTVDEPTFRISGWSCQGDNLPARRAAIGCMLNRLILLTRRKRAETGGIVRPCRAQAQRLRDIGRAGSSADWVTGADNPHCAAPAI